MSLAERFLDDAVIDTGNSGGPMFTVVGEPEKRCEPGGAT
jgi:hypothetical protein